jgi:hypothetical protein
MLHLHGTKTVNVFKGLILLSAFIFPSHKIFAQKNLEYSADWNLSDHDYKALLFWHHPRPEIRQDFILKNIPGFYRMIVCNGSRPLNSPGFALGLSATAG